jgi:hypothetical protein
MKPFLLLRSIPILGPLLRIANSYAFHGDNRADTQFAGVWRWLKAMGPELLVAVLLTAVILWPLPELSLKAGRLVTQPLTDFQSKPGALIASVIPSFLGFGIGVYALVFALSGQFVRAAHLAVETQKASGKRKVGSVLMLNADLAFPLVILLLSLALGFLQQAFPSSFALTVAAWVFAWYSLLAMLSIIVVIFGLAEHSLLDKIE